jgi:type I restriction enzyme M protein
MTREERFLEALAALGGSAGNARLQAELGWQEATYSRVQAALVEERKIVKGRGRGGSVALAEPEFEDIAEPVEPPKPRAAVAKPASRGSNGNGGSFEQIFKNIDDVLWKQAGCTTELDYTEQTSWMLFLKYFDDLEFVRATEAELHGKTYSRIIDAPHSWSSWAAPKKLDGSFDHDRACTGPDLIDYVNRDLFPYLEDFKSRAAGPDTIEYKIGEIFSEIRSKFQSGYSLRDALELIDGLRFRSQAEKHELSHGSGWSGLELARTVSGRKVTRVEPF